MGPACPGDDPNRDLHTFRPAGPHCTYRLGRRAEVCDVPLVSERNPGLVSRIHAEIHAERDPHSTAGEWRVCLVDCSTHALTRPGSLAAEPHPRGSCISAPGLSSQCRVPGWPLIMPHPRGGCMSVATEKIPE
ncbi:unnamed protein product, partial [Natator depressus]